MSNASSTPGMTTSLTARRLSNSPLQRPYANVAEPSTPDKPACSVCYALVTSAGLRRASSRRSSGLKTLIGASAGHVGNVSPSLSTVFMMSSSQLHIQLGMCPAPTLLSSSIPPPHGVVVLVMICCPELVGLYTPLSRSRNLDSTRRSIISRKHCTLGHGSALD